MVEIVFVNYWSAIVCLQYDGALHGDWHHSTLLWGACRPNRDMPRQHCEWNLPGRHRV